MPCRSDHMEPSKREKEASRVYTLIDEINTNIFNRNYYNGYHPQAYNACVTQEQLDRATAELCSMCQQVSVEMYSNELQDWWHNHQLLDKRRQQEECEHYYVRHEDLFYAFGDTHPGYKCQKCDKQININVYREYNEKKRKPFLGMWI